MRRIGLRLMLLGPLVATLAVGAGALGVFIHRSVEQDQIRTIDDELTRALVVAIGQGGLGAGARPAPGDGAGPDADSGAPQEVVVDARGEVIDAESNATDLAARDLRGLVGATDPVTIDGTPRLRAVAVPRRDGTTVVVALSLASVDESLASLRRNLLIGTAVLIVVQALVASVVVSAVNRPVSRLSATAHRIAGGDLHAEIGRASGPREAVMLTEDLDAMVTQLREEIAGRERAAASADQARSDMERFMADASHELRTPLTAVKGFSELYDAGMLDDDGVGQAMTRIGAESGRLTDLVNDLLRLLRPTDAQTEEVVDMAAIASAVVQDLRAAYATHPISLELDRDQDCSVVGDPTRLHQAVLNLGANACQHTPANTPITVQATRREREDVTVVRIVDHGPGIDPAMAASLFEPFVRADRSRSRQSHDGAGLGLTITQRITEQHGGSVEVAATPGGGATFTLELPATDGEPTQPNL